MATRVRQSGDRLEIYENGSYCRCVTVSGLRAVSCDGVYAGALCDDRVEVYKCDNGHYIRTINQRSSSIQVSNGRLILQVNGKTEEYNISNGNLERIYG